MVVLGTTEYTQLHNRIRKLKPQQDYCKRCAVGKCDDCGKRRRLQLASIGHTYTEDPKDYRWLCKACHVKLDLGRPRSRPGDIAERQCVWCGGPFMPRVPKQKACSLKCAARENWRNRRPKGGDP